MCIRIHARLGKGRCLSTKPCGYRIVLGMPGKVFSGCDARFVVGRSESILFQLYLMYPILLKLVVHGHGRGKRLGTCLVLQPCVSCVVSL